MINKYIEVMGPKLHAVAQNVLDRLFKERGALLPPLAPIFCPAHAPPPPIHQASS